MSTQERPLTQAEQISSLVEAVARIEYAIVGDRPMGHIGLVDRVDLAEVNITTIKQERRDEANQKRGALFVVSSIGAVGGTIGAFITWLSTHGLTK